MNATAVVRGMTREDLPAVVAIERGSFTTPWSEETFVALLQRPRAVLLVMERGDDGVVGYAILWCVLDEGELANIALREDVRGEGLGGRLLDRVLETARERGVRFLYLEVRESNEAARRLYASRGFEEVGERRDYYSAPREDARVLRKTL